MEFFFIMLISNPFSTYLARHNKKEVILNDHFYISSTIHK
ncbi:hypothetical protein RV08_GL002167 [Enterococcus mundtii]|nr:hypothetical protein RV08_GL002167 [Enterococcus mundtii]